MDFAARGDDPADRGAYYRSSIGFGIAVSRAINSLNWNSTIYCKTVSVIMSASDVTKS